MGIRNRKVTSIDAARSATVTVPPVPDDLRPLLPRDGAA